MSIELLGGFRVVGDARPTVCLPTTRQQQLLAFLILNAGPVPRQRLAGSLWPDSTDAQALTNLRRELHYLRDDWPRLHARIDATARTLAWSRRGGLAVDVDAFDEDAARGLAGDREALERAASRYAGELLPDCPGEWIDEHRERLRSRARAVLQELLERLEQDRAFDQAIERAQQLLRLDPLDEPAWCALMRAHARRGDRAAALHAYQQCTAVLKKDLGVPPGAAVRMTYREILDLDADAPPPSPPPRQAVYPLVGRQAEWQTLLASWRAAAAGHPSAVVIRGEAGIGKTRLAEELLDWCAVNGVNAASARCYAGEGRLAYAPIAGWLGSDPLQRTFASLAPSTLSDVARLRPELTALRPDVRPPEGGLESWQRLRFFEAMAQTFKAAAPLVLVLDDVQWADAETLEWLHYLLRTLSDTSCLVVCTLRAEEERDNAPLGRVLTQLGRDRLLTTIALGPLDETATARLAGEVAEQPLDAAALAGIFQQTEGHPLFIVERGRIAGPRAAAAADAALPEVQAVVAARLARLSDDARSVAEVAAAVGRDFDFELLAAASDFEEQVVVRALDELWQRHIVRAQAAARWDFSHDRIREVAYAGIGPARRRLIHRRIASAMERLFASRIDEVSAAIAAHLDRGGQPARAIPFLERAAVVASRVSASEEAIRCLMHALSLVEGLPAGRERDAQELALRSMLSVPLNSARGYAALEVEQNLARVFSLSRTGDDLPVRWLWAAFTLRFMLGDVKGARDVCEQALRRSETDPSSRCEAHHAMGAILLSGGELEASRRHFEQSLAAYDEQHPQLSVLGSDLGVFAHAWFAHTLWLLGEEDAALAHAEQGVALARRRDSPYSETLALAYSALLHQLRGDATRLLDCAEAVVALCGRHGFGYYGDWAHALIGWARGRDRPDDGIRRIEAALARLDVQRAQARRPYYLSLLADTYARLGDRERASSILVEAIEMASARGDTWWLPAMYLQQSALQPTQDAIRSRARARALAAAQGSRRLAARIETAELEPS